MSLLNIACDDNDASLVAISETDRCGFNLFQLDYTLSAHLKERAAERGIPLVVIESILNSPDQVIDDKSGEDNQKIYQSIVDFPEKGAYLIRVFVNCSQQPNVVKSVYKTSDIKRYS